MNYWILFILSICSWNVTNNAAKSGKLSEYGDAAILWFTTLMFAINYLK